MPGRIRLDERAHVSSEPRYVVVSTAYNESAHIERLIESVTTQTILPLWWVIVTDGCTDNTAEIVRTYARKWPFIELVELGQHNSHGFASKVMAFRAGVARVDGAAFDYIANLDADISLGPSYFADVLMRFASDPLLGIGGGAICEWDGRETRPRSLNTTSDVAGAVQMFRRECYEAVGGFLPLEYGGEDWASQVFARMAGWRVATFPEFRVLHDPGPEGAMVHLRRGIRQGRMDFALGSHPLYEVVRLCRRVRLGLPALVCFVRMAAFIWGYCKREKRLVSAEFVRFLRAQEALKVCRRLGRLWPGVRASVRPAWRPGCRP